MVRARRLIPYESEELKAIHLWAENAGIVAASTPKNDTEWEEFEDLYFELKDLIKFQFNPNDIANSLSDLTCAIWNLRRHSEIDIFVTLNLSILNARDLIKNQFKIQILNIAEVLEYLKGQNDSSYNL